MFPRYGVVAQTFVGGVVVIALLLRYGDNTYRLEM